MKLAAKFNLVLIFVLLLGFGVTGYSSYTILQKNARQEILDRASIMMESALAMRSYTVSEVRPLLAVQIKRKFLPQTVPAYAATQTFETLRAAHPEYTYKEATLNPTNPRDRAVDWESDIIQQFRNHPELKQVIGERLTSQGQSLYVARPIQIKKPACLVCHSTAAAAPASMIALYGDANGFGWKMDEVVGAQIISVPMSVPIGHAEDAFVTFMGTLGAVFIVIIIVLNLMLQSIVVRPVTTMAGLADQVSKGKMDSPEFAEGGRNEIAVLGASFNRMRRSLEKAMNMLEE